MRVKLFPIISPDCIILDIYRQDPDHNDTQAQGQGNIRVSAQGQGNIWVSDRVTRNIKDFQSLILYLAALFPGLIPPPAPPHTTVDISLIKMTITRILDWIQEYSKISQCEAWIQFTTPGFSFMAPPLTPPKPRLGGGNLITSLFFGRAPGVKDVDVFFDDSKKNIMIWQKFLSGIGRINDSMGRKLQESSFLNRTVALKLLELTESCKDQIISRKNIKYYESISTLNSLMSIYRLTTLEEYLLTLLQSTSLVLSCLDYRIQCLENYDYACTITSKRLSTLDALRNARLIQAVKVDAALQEMSAAKKQESDAKCELKTCTEELRVQIGGYEKWRDAVMEGLLDVYVEKMIEGCNYLLEQLNGVP